MKQSFLQPTCLCSKTTVIHLPMTPRRARLKNGECLVAQSNPSLLSKFVHHSATQHHTLTLINKHKHTHIHTPRKNPPKTHPKYVDLTQPANASTPEKMPQSPPQITSLLRTIPPDPQKHNAARRLLRDSMFSVGALTHSTVLLRSHPIQDS